MTIIVATSPVIVMYMKTIRNLSCFKSLNSEKVS